MPRPPWSLRSTFLALTVLGLPASQAQEHGHHTQPATGSDSATARHRFDVIQWAQVFEDPSRDAWQLPDSVVAALVERDDLVVADIGSATGYFPVHSSRRLPRGLVIGADIEPGMVYSLNDRARRAGLRNLVSVLAAPGDPHLPQPVDLIFLGATYHHIDGRIAYFKRLITQLRPGGRIAIVDWRLDSKRGPPHKLAKEAVLSEMERAGYTLLEEHNFLPEQYFLVFALPE